MISIVDYGVGNIGSIVNMLKRVGVATTIARTPKDISTASRLLLPGVGAFSSGMSAIDSAGIRSALDEAALLRKIPILGICLGAQLMTKGSEEGDIEGLGWINAETLKFIPDPSLNCRVPHMGWNTISASDSAPLVGSESDEKKFYFVHSYYMKCELDVNSLCKTSYAGILFDSGVMNENIVGVQFHPEKSHKFGMKLLSNFANWKCYEAN